ncbi:hypothetical protein CRYUN_Cryun04dG0079800 [Craigia yunnanensis]
MLLTFASINHSKCKSAVKKVSWHEKVKCSKKSMVVDIRIEDTFLTVIPPLWTWLLFSPPLPFFRIAYLRMVEPRERDAQLMRHSLFGRSLDLNILIEVACTSPSSELLGIKHAYQTRYNSDLEIDLTMKVNGGFKEILLAVLKSFRNYGGKEYMSLAMCDAKTLYEALESGKNIDSEDNNLSFEPKEQWPSKSNTKLLQAALWPRIRSRIDIQGINKAFVTKRGSSLENLVMREFNRSMDKTNDIVVGILVGLI